MRFAGPPGLPLASFGRSTQPALVVRTWGAYFGFSRKETSFGPASESAAAPSTTNVGSPSSSPPLNAASSCNVIFMSTSSSSLELLQHLVRQVHGLVAEENLGAVDDDADPLLPRHFLDRAIDLAEQDLGLLVLQLEQVLLHLRLVGLELRLLVLQEAAALGELVLQVAERAGRVDRVLVRDRVGAQARQR